MNKFSTKHMLALIAIGCMLNGVFAIVTMIAEIQDRSSVSRAESLLRSFKTDALDVMTLAREERLQRIDEIDGHLREVSQSMRSGNEEMTKRVDGLSINDRKVSSKLSVLSESHPWLFDADGNHSLPWKAAVDDVDSNLQTQKDLADELTIRIDALELAIIELKKNSVKGDSPNNNGEGLNRSDGAK